MSSFKDVDKKIKSKQAPEEKKLYTADFPELVDLVSEGGKIRFLTFDKSVTDRAIIDGLTYYPPREVLWLLPDSQKVLNLAKEHTVKTDDTDAVKGCVYCSNTLYPKLLNYFKQFSQLLTEYHYHYLVIMALHSHLIEKFNYSPILFLFGAPGRGKTPVLKSLAYISRRGLVTETFREANIIRWANDFKVSLFFDSRDFPKKVELHNCEDLIYGRAERGAKASRVLYPEKGAFQDMINFSIFGVTGATSNFMVDDITEARCIVFNMPLSSIVFDLEPSEALGLPLREELVAFRLVHAKQPLLPIAKASHGKMENYLRGFHQLVNTYFPEYEEDFLNFKRVIVEQKEETAGTSFEGRIIQLVTLLRDKAEIGGLCLAYEDICNGYNANHSRELNERAMANILKGLGFQAKRNSLGTKRGIFYDEDFIVKLWNIYGMGTPPGESSETSETSGSDPADATNSEPEINKLPGLEGYGKS